ncbi:MAG: hypothetical protein ACF8NJ_08495, partial [Phycisphaerales bacterium JB038]
VEGRCDHPEVRSLRFENVEVPRDELGAFRFQRSTRSLHARLTVHARFGLKAPIELVETAR